MADPHPSELVELDRPYLIRWGRRDMLLLAARTAILGAAVVAVAIVARAPAVLSLAVVPALVLIAGVVFFRNPRRRVPVEPGILVSPADGTVRDVGVVNEGEYLLGPALRVGIFLSILDVHVNRAPESGEVEYLRYRPGKFHDARDPRCPTENESQTIGIRLDPVATTAAGDRVLVRQVSGAIARRILCPLVVGQRLARGGLIGMIKYGSRTELHAPAEGWESVVRPGDRVRGGVSVLFRRRSSARE